MTISDISPSQLQLFFLVFIRLAAIVAFMPVFSSKTLPLIFKAGLTFAVSFLLFPILDLPVIASAIDPVGLGLAIAAEIILGLMIGFVFKIILGGFQMAGQLAGYQMGMALANVMDPSTSEQVPLLAQFNNLLALMILLAVNAHHFFIQAVIESFRFLPPLGMNLHNAVFKDLIYLAGNLFVIAIKVGAPVVVALLLVSVSFGLIARTVPQMNVFIVAMPLKIMIGLIFVGLGLPFIVAYMERLYAEGVSQILLLVRALG
jgi:flagellar biosynthetic protein FliR